MKLNKRISKNLKLTTEMTDDEINEFISRCDFSNFKSR